MHRASHFRISWFALAGPGHLTFGNAISSVFPKLASLQLKPGAGACGVLQSRNKPQVRQPH